MRLGWRGLAGAPARRLLETEEGPAEGLEPIDKWQNHRTAGKKGEYYLIYFGKERPTEWTIELPRAGVNDPLTLEGDLIDTWEMLVTPLVKPTTSTGVVRLGTAVPSPTSPWPL